MEGIGSENSSISHFNFNETLVENLPPPEKKQELEFFRFLPANWNMLNTPAILQSKLDALNLTQIINEPTRYLPKAVNKGTLIDIILTNLPSKYTSAVFNQDLSNHCLIVCIRNGSAVKQPPLITIKLSLKH